MLGPLFVLVAASVVATASAQYTDTNARPYPGTWRSRSSYVPQPGPTPSNPTHVQPSKPTYGQPSQPTNEQPSQPPRPTYPQPSQPTYGPPIFPPPRDLTGDIAEARARISGLTITDKMTNTRLDGLMAKIRKVKDFRKDFSDNILPTEQARVKEEDGRIASAVARLRDHAALADEVAALTAKVNNFVAGLRRAREVYNSINADINDLVLIERDQQMDISNIKAEEEGQVRFLAECDDKVTTNKNFANSLYDPLIKVVDIVNAERAESVHFVINPTGGPVTHRFSTPFSRVPYIHIGTSGYTLEPPPFISIDGRLVLVNATAEDFTIAVDARFVNLGTSEKVFVVVTAYVIDNTRIEYSGTAITPPKNRPHTKDYNGMASSYV